jgi:PAS domain S-box-containing protein
MQVSTPTPEAPEGAAPAPWLRRWWLGQSASRQDRLAVLAPLAAVLLFLAAIASAFTYLRTEEQERELEAVKRDVEYAQQRVRLRMLERQEQLMRLARDVANREIDSLEFMGRAEAMVLQHPELQTLSWIDDRRRAKVSYASPSLVFGVPRPVGEILRGNETEAMFGLARDLQQPVYSQPQAGADNGSVLQLHVPMLDQGRFLGVVLAEFSVDSLLRYAVPPEVTARYAVALLDGNDQVLAGSTVSAGNGATRLLPWLVQAANEYEVPVSPVGNGLMLRAQAYRTSQGLIGTGLFWLVGVLSVMTAWMLIGNWRHTRRRLQTQRALVAETNFRRAMENSMLTGMRALDLQGRITYVNPAFCQMTGWGEAELVNRLPPFPYWPEADREMLTARLEDELQGRTVPGGFQVRVKRKDGSLFDARMYVSPLVDAAGRQTGWMTSMTDITEPNRIRAQLEASHQRFTTVLEALDASVSVAPLGSEELLFANRLYRQWFGTRSAGHLQLVAQAGMPAHPPSDDTGDDVDALVGLPADQIEAVQPGSAEIFERELDKWLEVRTRYLTWVDGRLAQMVIATDITARRRAEEQAALQAERAQSASRLITMGEMASSVAHELNQPLTAISNYCNGMVSRIRGRQIEEADLLAALEKTARQAQRAGQIIQRIRTFVKRSEPNRTLADIAPMVAEAVELVEIELRRHNVRLSPYIAARLPRLMVDPILIEQVLVNLLKNAAESVNAAQRPAPERNVELRVVPMTLEEQPGVEFSVRDSGRGLAPEVMERLFEAFFSTKAEGMGIGLNLCRTIVESHHGRMDAQNIYNGTEVAGCMFSFWIPEPGAAQDLTDKNAGVTA